MLILVICILFLSSWLILSLKSSHLDASLKVAETPCLGTTDCN